MNDDSESIAVAVMHDRSPVVVARSGSPVRNATAPVPANAVVARLAGFDLSDRPLVAGLAAFPHRLVVAETTVALDHTTIGQRVVVLLVESEPISPIVIGVVAATAPRHDEPARADVTDPTVTVDSERRVIEAAREIVLRCGDASITLTRAGKVIIEGTYIVSRSTGYNRIKGAAVDIN